MKPITTNGTPISAQAAEAEPVEQRLPFKPAVGSAEVHLHFRGVPIMLSLVAPSVLDVERFVQSMLARDGWSAPAQSGQALAAAGDPRPTNGKRPTQARVTPAYSDAGEPMCPVHHRELQKRAWGYSCTAKAGAGDIADKNGYCGLRFES